MVMLMFKYVLTENGMKHRIQMSDMVYQTALMHTAKG